MSLTKPFLYVLAAMTAACVMPPPNGPTAPSEPTATAASETDTATEPDGALPPAGPAATADDGSGPPAVRRTIPGERAMQSGPYGRGDYIIALDYRPEGFGTYGFLYNDAAGQVWIVENDVVVGGPLAETGPELQQVVARWTAAERRRHEVAMQGIASLPKGCLDGCAFDTYRNGAYTGRRIAY